MRSDDGDILLHGFAKLAAQVAKRIRAKLRIARKDTVGRCGGFRRRRIRCGIFRGIFPRDQAEYDRFRQRAPGEAVGSVQSAGDLAAGIEACNVRSAVGAQRHAAHEEMRHRADEQRLIRVIARHTRNVGTLALEIRLVAAGKVEPHFLFGELGARDDVAVFQLLHRVAVTVHEPLALLVAQYRAVVEEIRENIRPPGRIDTVGVKLHKLHALQRQSAARSHGVAVAGHIARVARRSVYAAGAAAAEDHRFGRVNAQFSAAERKSALRAAVPGEDIANGHTVLHGDVGMLVQLPPHGLCENTPLLG